MSRQWLRKCSTQIIPNLNLSWSFGKTLTINSLSHPDKTFNSYQCLHYVQRRAGLNVKVDTSPSRLLFTIRGLKWTTTEEEEDTHSSLLDSRSRSEGGSRRWMLTAVARFLPLSSRGLWSTGTWASSARRLAGCWSACSTTTTVAPLTSVSHNVHRTVNIINSVLLGQRVPQSVQFHRAVEEDVPRIRPRRKRVHWRFRVRSGSETIGVQLLPNICPGNRMEISKYLIVYK